MNFSLILVKIEILFKSLNQKIMKKLFTLLLSAFLISQSFAQVGAWNTFALVGGSADYGPSPFAPTTLDANLSSGGLVRGIGLTTTGTGAGKVWGANGFTFGTAQGAIDSNKVITFSITPNTSYKTSLTTLDSIRIRVSASGPISYLIQYAIGAGAYQDLGTRSITRPGTTSNFALEGFILSGIAALQNIPAATTVTFRIAPFSATSASGTFYIGNNSVSQNNISLTGSVALPVTLKALSASLINNQPQVNWATSTEINFDYFGVEKSLDTKNFVEIAKLASNKASNGSAYQYTDINKTLSTQFYRLKLVDNDGTFKYSSVVAVNGKASLELAIYPNPVTNTIILSHPKAVAGASLKIVGIDGRTLSTNAVATGATQTSLDVTKLVKGNYVVSFVNNGVASAIQLVK